jgi:hypothetical protein
MAIFNGFIVMAIFWHQFYVFPTFPDSLSRREKEELSTVEIHNSLGTMFIIVL